MSLDADFAAILDGKTTLDETKDFLTRSVAWMADPEALAAGARAMRERMVRVTAPDGAIDVCGTGGDGAHTLNISTAVAFVVAGCGVAVAKHGNRAMSSRSGAADVLEALGVKLTGDVSVLERCLRDARVAFLFAQNHHPAMRHVAQARRELGFRTIFNLLGPLSNPASVTRQLVGVFGADFVAPMAEALLLLGAERAVVVHGEGGLDEASLSGVTLVDDAGLYELRSADLGLPPCDAAALKGGAAQENAAALRALLGHGEPGPYRDIVVLNAALALRAAGQDDPLSILIKRALLAIDDGRALAALDALIALTKDAP